jgi:hypothetical protein
MIELVPIAIFCSIVAIAGLYFAEKERKESQKRRPRRR